MPVREMTWPYPWTSPGGFSNALQSAEEGSGGLISNFTNLTGSLLSPTGEVVTLEYLHIGVATNAFRSYRVLLP